MRNKIKREKKVAVKNTATFVLNLNITDVYFLFSNPKLLKFPL